MYCHSFTGGKRFKSELGRQAELKVSEINVPYIEEVLFLLIYHRILGLEIVDKTDIIMYPYMQSSNVENLSCLNEVYLQV